VKGKTHVTYFAYAIFMKELRMFRCTNACSYITSELKNYVDLVSIYCRISCCTANPQQVVHNIYQTESSHTTYLQHLEISSNNFTTVRRNGACAYAALFARRHMWRNSACRNHSRPVILFMSQDQKLGKKQNGSE